MNVKKIVIILAIAGFLVLPDVKYILGLVMIVKNADTVKEYINKSIIIMYILRLKFKKIQKINKIL